MKIFKLVLLFLLYLLAGIFFSCKIEPFGSPEIYFILENQGKCLILPRYQFSQ